MVLVASSLKEHNIALLFFLQQSHKMFMVVIDFKVESVSVLFVVLQIKKVHNRVSLILEAPLSLTIGNRCELAQNKNLRCYNSITFYS